ncbi:hypothetical protein Pmani_001069 [Petrolisthes manimaculis]|uniref:Uncharacterized protein n=1 Tax=Petrolisthes manimaculis TaxID=1843537 RepID=A0AAE1UKQ5_9EUCA|nr:hypothetical protein Pmani_001069 [Petrolisthes manimaculis]
MPESSAVMKKRQRHFWKWITETKKLPRGAMQDRALANRLRSEHSRAFPSIYFAVKLIDAKESIHLFHCKLLRFNKSLKDGDPVIPSTATQNSMSCNYSTERSPQKDPKPS